MDNPNLRELLGHLEQVTETSNGWDALCPAHDDHRPSLGVSVGADGRILLNCRSNHCDPVTIMQCVGMSAKQLFVPVEDGGAKQDWGRLAATYDYQDEKGKLIFQVCRFEKVTRLSNGQDERTKTFRQRQPNPDGNGWTWKVKGLSLVLYRLPELMASPTSQPVFVVEGEKQVDYLHSIGFIATCNPAGAGKWKAEYGKHLGGRDVIVVPDNDPIKKSAKTGEGTSVGMEHAETVADSLCGVARSVHVLHLPDCGPKWGLDDWLQNGHDPGELAELLEQTEPWFKGQKLFDRNLELKPGELPRDSSDPYANHRAVCLMAGIDVLGETGTGGVLIYSRQHRKTQEFKSVAKLQYEDVLQFSGSPAREAVYVGSDEVPDGMVSMKQVRASIAILAGRHRVDENLRGAGVWKEPEGHFVLVNRGEIIAIDENQQMEIAESAEFRDRIYDLNDVNESWLDRVAFTAAWAASREDEWCRQRISAATKMFAAWSFRNEEIGNHAELLTGLVMASWIQSTWRWCPQVFVLGESNTGKSTLFEVIGGSQTKQLRGIFGPLSLKSSNYTSAALQQGIGHSSKIAICDEFEDSAARQDILKLVRAAGRGDPIIRGSQSRRMTSTALHQIFWMASTESGLRREMDQNRFIVIELIRTTNEAKYRAFSVPDDTTIHNLGIDLLAISVRVCARANALANLLYKSRPPGVHDRICESFSVPAAILAAGKRLNDEESLQLYYDLLRLTDADAVEPDRLKIIDEILNSGVRTRTGDINVSRIVCGHPLINTAEYAGTEQERILADHGVMVCRRDSRDDKSEVGLFLHPPAIQRKLLKDTEWRNSKLSDILKRISGSYSCVKNIAGTASRGFFVPLASLPSIAKNAG